MTKRTLPVLVAALGMLLPGCELDGNVTGPSVLTGSSNIVITASGTLTTQVRAVSGFTAVAINVPGLLTIEHSNLDSLTITGDEAVVSAITSEVRDGELSIGLVDNTDLGLNELDEIEYQVTLRDLRGLRVNGVARVVATEIDTPQLDVTIGGVSNVTASGRAERQNVFVSGTSRYEAQNLISREVTVDVSGVAAAFLNVSETLNGHVSGAGLVEYAGNPTVSVTVSGAGSVRPQ